MVNNAKVNYVLGELESEVMNIIWQQKTAISVKQVVIILQKRRKIAYTTVMTIMNRLVEKGLLKQENSDTKAFLYPPVYSKRQFLSKTAREIIKNVVSKFGDTAIAHFANEVDKIPIEKRKKLIKMLEEPEE